ncbi:MAG: ABC transporter substrate-binding protein [Gemmatimonadaceae bacterium]
MHATARLPLAALLGALATAACRGGESNPERRTLIDSRDNYDPRSLDPALATDVPSGRAVSYLYDGLMRFTPDARLEPALAERSEVSPDGRTYTFHLRRGVKFHDGTALTARHVVGSFRRLLDPSTKSGSAEFFKMIRGSKAFTDRTSTDLPGVVARDDSTVVITLEEPLAFFPKLLAMPAASIVPLNAGADLAQKPVGTGPWKLVEWKHDDYVLFARNEQYWAGPAQAESLMARIIPEQSTAVAEFESGNVDVMLVPEAETRRWQDTDERNARLAEASALRLWYVGINTTRGPLADVRVRQALNIAVDRATILKQLISGRGTLAAGVIPPSLEGATKGRPPYAYDPAKAKRLLAEAGHANGVTLELWHSATAPAPRLAQTIQAYLQASGFKITLVQREAAAMRAAARKGETDLVLKDWFADYPDAENFLYPLLHSANKGAGGNVSFYQSPRFDQVVDQARRTTNDSARVALYRQADQIAYADAPMIFLWFYNELYALQPWIQNFQVPVIFNGQNMTGVQIRRTLGQ